MANRNSWNFASSNSSSSIPSTGSIPFRFSSSFRNRSYRNVHSNDYDSKDHRNSYLTNTMDSENSNQMANKRLSLTAELSYNFSALSMASPLTKNPKNKQGILSNASKLIRKHRKNLSFKKTEVGEYVGIDSENDEASCPSYVDPTNNTTIKVLQEMNERAQSMFIC